MVQVNDRPLDPDLIVGWLQSTFRDRAQQKVLAGVADDDCGVLEIGNTIIVVSADFLNATPIVEQLGLADEYGLGRISVAATLSDLLGSGAKPCALVVGVTVPHGYPEARFKRLMLGVRFEARKWKVPVISGDTKLGHARAVLTCGFGTVNSRRELFLTSQAREGDVIVASGHLGSCAAATLLAATSPETRLPGWARSAIANADLPIRQSRGLATIHAGNGGIDVSDGLGADLRRLCGASEVGAELVAADIPVLPAVRRLASKIGVEPWSFSFASGGDFQFIATVRKAALQQVLDLGFSVIGRTTKNPAVLLRRPSGKLTDLPKVGHRDRRGQLFSDEILAIVKELSDE